MLQLRASAANQLFAPVQVGTSDPLIVAAGDCTARRLADGNLLRLESVQNATEQGKSAAAALLGQERPFTATPWFWSDQYDRKLQMAGLSTGADTWAVRGTMTDGPFYPSRRWRDGGDRGIEFAVEHLLAEVGEDAVELGDQLGALRRVHLFVRKRLQQQVFAGERQVDRIRAQPVAAGLGGRRIGLAQAAQHRQRQGVAVHAEEARELAVIGLEGRHLPSPAAEQCRQPVERESRGGAEQGCDRP